MAAPLDEEERDLRHLERLGVFDSIAGLIVSKPEVYEQLSAPFDYDDLVLEIVGSNKKYPIVTQFDCGHTNPTLTLAEHSKIQVTARSGFDVEVTVLEPMVE